MEANNMKAMREAVEACLFYLERVDHGMNDYMRGLFENAYKKAKAALEKPPRNCDVGSASEQADRYRNFADRYNPCSYNGYARCAEDCPVHIKLTQEGHGELQCQLEWGADAVRGRRKQMIGDIMELFIFVTLAATGIWLITVKE